MLEIWESKISNPDIDDDKLTFEVNEEIFQFTLDEYFLSLIQKWDNLFLAIYQYTISFCEKKKMLLKRLHIRDVYTHAYCQEILMAFESPVSLEPVFDVTNFKFTYDCPDGLLPCHKEVSLMELISLVDSRKCRVISSSPIQYVHALSSSETLFKKVGMVNEISFKVADGNDRNDYEILETYISRYHKRVNGKDILLAEFSVFYDFVGKSILNLFI